MPVCSKMISKDESISVVVPVFRSASSLAKLYDRCTRQLNELSNDWELILVDDASTDNSWAEICTLRERDRRVKAIRLSHNHGQQHATLCGLGYSSKRYVITIDDDLQCFPEDMPLFIKQLKNGKEVVIGRIARQDKRHSWWRNLGSRMNQKLAGKIIGKPNEISLSSYRGLSKSVVQRLVAYKGAHPHVAALLFKSVPAIYIANVDIQHASRENGGKTSYSWPKLVKTLSYLLINHSYIPLRFMIGWGITISLVSLGFAMWVALKNIFFSQSQMGWTSLAVLISFLSGNILLALGVVGEYLGRLVEEASKITQFSVFEEKI